MAITQLKECIEVNNYWTLYTAYSIHDINTHTYIYIYIKCMHDITNEFEYKKIKNMMRSSRADTTIDTEKLSFEYAFEFARC
jgi:hypothetical protein